MKVGEVPPGRKPMLAVLLEELQARGFEPTEPTRENHATFWTHEDWTDWWRSTSGCELDADERRRYHLLMDTVAQVVGEESGFEKITNQHGEV